MSRAADPPIPTPLFRRIERDADAGQVAAAMSSILQEIDHVLVPIIGVRGVNALFTRSVHLASAANGWLVAGPYSQAELVALLAGRSDIDAAAGAEACLREFYDLLTALIGPSLTERVLVAVWAADSIRSIPQVPK